MPTTKRGRTDTGIGKEDYYTTSELPSRSPSHGNNFGLHVSGTQGGNAPSSSLGNALSGNASTTSLGNARRTVAVKKGAHGLKAEYLRGMGGLNASFVNHCVNAKAPSSAPLDFIEASLDYIAYASDLSATYLSPPLTTICTFGSGDCGQLAFGIDDDSQTIVKRPRKVMALAHGGVRCVAAGGLHNVACANDGDVYTWGCNDDGSVGRKGGEEKLVVPMIVPGVKGVCAGAGDCQTVVADKEGRVWMWGTYKDKEGKVFRDARAPASIRGKHTSPAETFLPSTRVGKVVQVACGASFNVARTDRGEVYTWGLGECGELGRDACPMKAGGEYDLDGILRTHLTAMSPRFMDGIKVGNGRYVRKVAAGAYHLLVITVESSAGGGGRLYTAGLNNYGQLGHGDLENRSCMTPVAGLEGERVADADGGMHHSLVACADGRVYAFGRGDSGQLGVKDDCGVGYCEQSPVPVPLPGARGKAEQVTCGANHNFVITDEKECYSWGYGDMAALGHGKEQDENRPRLLVLPKKAEFEGAEIVKAAGGGQHSCIIINQKR
mmetsp:Transcript_17175/g.34405  ORF Transcript_17175/g.34405 Transcript_17175/m.34405 type:complete len:551 (+) Transcript_17175:80-1732(+)